MKLSERLLKRLINDFPGSIPTTSSIRRIQRGRHGMSAGTWAWEVLDSSGVSLGIGSEDTMQACVKAKKLGSYDTQGDMKICAD